ncbi:MAG: DUF882 domain-containing protein [Geminicoccales bacterium]
MSGQGPPFDRRRVLGLPAAAASGAVLLSARTAQAAAEPARTLAFYSIHTTESLTAVYREDGHYVEEGLAAIDRELRDYRTGEVRRIDPKLLDVLYELCRALAHDGPIHVISGYRSPATNAMLARQSTKVAKNSYHMRGRAIDIRLPGRRLEAVRDAAIRLALGGVGYYPLSDFVHLDTGPPRRW